MKLASQMRFLARMISAAAFLFLAFSARFVQAGVIYSGTNFNIVVSDPVYAESSHTLKAVTLTAVGLNGYIPNVFDSVKNDYGKNGTGLMSTGTNLHQVYQHNDAEETTKTPTLTMDPDFDPLTSDQLAMDTHFLVYSDNIWSSVTPTENRPKTPGIGDYSGYGTYLKGVFLLMGASSESWNFAQLVTPNGTQVNLDFEIIGFLSSNPGQSISEEVIGSFTIPEPGAIMLLLTGGLGLMVYVLHQRKSRWQIL